MPGRVRTGRDAEGRRSVRDHRRVQARGCMAKRVIHTDTHTHTPTLCLTFEDDDDGDEDGDGGEDDEFRSAQMCLFKNPAAVS